MKNQNYDIFVSYSRKDIDKVLPIVQEIEALGVSVWIDLKGIESGEDFVDKIAISIDNADSVLFMYTKNSIQGEWTKKEVMYAKEQGKIVVPILVDGTMPSKGWFKFLYGTVDCIDITNPIQKKKLYDNLVKKYASSALPSTAQDASEQLSIKKEINNLQKHEEQHIQIEDISTTEKIKESWVVKLKQAQKRMYAGVRMVF